ncbi:MAG: alpha/beta fold hydrolase [Solirubrobacterales bacterium]
MPTTENVAIDSTASLFVETAGQGPPMVMVGGLGDDHTAYAPLIEGVADRFTCIAYDNRGSGDSSALPEGSDIGTLAEDGHRLLERLGLTQVVGIGCSMGGTVVQEWALRYPDDFSRLVLMSTFARPRRHMQALLNHWETLYEAGETKLLVESLALLSFSPGFWDLAPGVTEEVLAIDELAPGFLTQLRACATHDTVDRLGEIRHPALVIGGSEDLLISAANSEELAELLPDATLQIVPTGHVPFWEAPEETAAAVIAFCD